VRKVVKFYDLIAKLLKITSPFAGRVAVAVVVGVAAAVAAAAGVDVAAAAATSSVAAKF